MDHVKEEGIHGNGKLTIQKACSPLAPNSPHTILTEIATTLVSFHGSRADVQEICAVLRPVAESLTANTSARSAGDFVAQTISVLDKQGVNADMRKLSAILQGAAAAAEMASERGLKRKKTYTEKQAKKPREEKSDKIPVILRPHKPHSQLPARPKASIFVDDCSAQHATNDNPVCNVSGCRRHAVESRRCEFHMNGRSCNVIGCKALVSGVVKENDCFAAAGPRCWIHGGRIHGGRL